MKTTKRGVIVAANMTDEEKGLAHWGYNPSDGSGKTSSLLGRSWSALRNTDAVERAKREGFDGDWAATRKILRGVALATGLYFTRTPKP